VKSSYICALGGVLGGAMRALDLRQDFRAASARAFFLSLSSPAEHMWQWRHALPFSQPCGLQNQAHGLHSPDSCSDDPAETSGLRNSNGAIQ